MRSAGGERSSRKRRSVGSFVKSAGTKENEINVMFNKHKTQLYMHQNMIKIKRNMKKMRWMAAADTDRTSAATNDYFHYPISCQLPD